MKEETTPLEDMQHKISELGHLVSWTEKPRARRDFQFCTELFVMALSLHFDVGLDLVGLGNISSGTVVGMLWRQVFFPPSKCLEHTLW